MKTPTKKKKVERARLTKKQKELQQKVSGLFKCWLFEPEVCGVCFAIEKLVQDKKPSP